jgi:two-component system, OmpR family, phosphate regulon response regulator PhoB
MTTTVLVVEDDSWARAMAHMLLADEGYVVLEAETGEEAQQIAEEHSPDAILLDLGLPTKSGVDVLRDLKANPATRQIPVLVLSANAWRLKEGDARHAAGVLQKPYECWELLAEVEWAVEARRAVSV